MKAKSKKQKAKIRIGVIFGGRSAEHEVSLVSATSIINALDKKKYQIVPIGITPDGKWLSSPNVLKIFKEKKHWNRLSEKYILPDPTKQNLDVVFPVVHGTFGEDGTIQGLFELADIPYVGAGVLGSSVGMDKVITKQLCEQSGISVVPYVWFLKSEYTNSRNKIISTIEMKLGYPCFVKPANLGSSVGISKVKNRRQLINAIRLALKYDRKILIEKSIEHAREVEVSVLGNDDPVASMPGEIISSNEFYDYDAKYVDGKSEALIPAKLPPSIRKELKKVAVKAFKASECAGMARVDFLVSRKSNKIYFNEINTIPGFTSISMYPKLWEVSGIPYSRLLDQLIILGIERFHEKRQLARYFRPKRDWYKSS